MAIFDERYEQEELLGRGAFSEVRKVKDIQKGAQFNKYNYNLLATLSFDGTGVYFRYYPKSSQLLPEGSVNVGFMAVGVIFDM